MYKWDEMTVHERDVLVATKVMELPEPELSTLNGLWIHHFVRETYPGSGKLKEFRDEQKELSHYSTDISAAWEVVEKFDGYSIEKFQSNQSYTVCIYNPQPFFAQSKSVTEAICKAALKAVSVDIE